MKTGATTTSLWGSQDKPFLRKNTPALHRNREHWEKEGFHLLVGTASYRRPGWLLWWSQRSLQFLRDPSLGRLYLSLTILSGPSKSSASPQILVNAFLLSRFLFTALLYFQHSAFQPQTSPPPFTPQKNNPERRVPHLGIHSCYFGLKADCPSQLMVITSSVRNG